MQSSEAKPTQENPTNKSADTLKSLENLITESLQLYELYNQKENTTDELVNSLRIITEYLRFSINIHPSVFDLPATSNVILLPSLELVIREVNGKTEQKRLDQLTTDKISKMLENVIPILLNMIQKEKGNLTEKIAFLRGASSRLKELHNLKHTENVKPDASLEGAPNQNV